MSTQDGLGAARDFRGLAVGINRGLRIDHAGFQPISDQKRLCLCPVGRAGEVGCDEVEEVSCPANRIRMPIPKRLAQDGNGLSVKPLRLGIPPLRLHHPREVVEAGGIVGMPLANRGAVDIQRLPV